MWNWLKKQYNQFIALMVKIGNFFSSSNSNPKTQKQTSSPDDLSNSSQKMADSGLKKSNMKQDVTSEVAAESNLTPLEQSIKLSKAQEKLINQKLEQNKGLFNSYGMYKGYTEDAKKLNEYNKDIEFLQRQAKFDKKESPPSELPSPR